MLPRQPVGRPFPRPQSPVPWADCLQPGSREGTANARVPEKRRWISVIRPIRDELKTLRDEGKITPSVYRLYYRRAKGGVYKSRSHLRMHMINAGYLKEEE